MESETVSPGPFGANQGLGILVVEDNAALACVVQFNLRRAGFDVQLAANGRLAWERLARRSFLAVVTDEQMPEMSGVELIDRMRSSDDHVHTPVVMITAKRHELNLSQLQDAGVVHVLPKPFSPRTLVELVQKLAEESGSPTSGSPTSGSPTGGVGCQR